MLQVVRCQSQQQRPDGKKRAAQTGVRRLRTDRNQSEACGLFRPGKRAHRWLQGRAETVRAAAKIQDYTHVHTIHPPDNQESAPDAEEAKNKRMIPALT
jgi:hypothetical protein